MDTQTNRIPLAGYRVVAHHRDHSESLVTLAENGRQAVCLAKAFCNALEANGGRHGIISVRTQEWVGFLDHGEWRTKDVQRVRFAQGWERRKPGSEAPKPGSIRDESSNLDQPTSPLARAGDSVKCFLREEKTRKGGWMANFLMLDIVGPIMNSADVPSSAKPGQVVMLRIGAINHQTSKIQFCWVRQEAAVGRF